MVRQYKVQRGKPTPPLLTRRRVGLCFFALALIAVENSLTSWRDSAKSTSSTYTVEMKTTLTNHQSGESPKSDALQYGSHQGDFSNPIRSQEAYHADTASYTNSNPVIDIVSIGSINQPAYQDAQKRTFGSHRYVRNFFRIDELNDTESDCYTELQMNTTGNQIVSYCRQTKMEFPLLNRLRHVFIKRGELEMKMNPEGWLCAQKRPIDGFVLALRKYKKTTLRNEFHSGTIRRKLEQSEDEDDDDSEVSSKNENNSNSQRNQQVGDYTNQTKDSEVNNGKLGIKSMMLHLENRNNDGRGIDSDYNAVNAMGNPSQISRAKSDADDYDNYGEKVQPSNKEDTSRSNVNTVNDDFPDYLVIADDDTYLNMDLFGPHLVENYPSNIPHAVAGCLIRLRHGFTLPFGGFSYTINKAALKNFVRPIYCNGIDIDDDFIRNACFRIRENNVGEGGVHKDGMSVADLMYAYTFDQPFLDIENWNNVGFCMHSDMVMSYFIQYYNIPVHSGDPLFEDVPTDRFRAYNGSVWYRGSKKASHMSQRGECANMRQNCTLQSHICHYVNPDHMEALFRDQDYRY